MINKQYATDRHGTNPHGPMGDIMASTPDFARKESKPGSFLRAGAGLLAAVLAFYSSVGCNGNGQESSSTPNGESVIENIIGDNEINNLGVWTIKKADLWLFDCDSLSAGANGKLYSISYTKLNEYDPETDEWARKADMLFEGGSLAAGTIDGKLYAISNSKLHEYDPETDEWTRKADMLFEGGPLAAVAIDGKLYAISHNKLNEYDPETDEWTRKADMPFARESLAAGTIDGKLYAISHNKLHRYDPETHKWTRSHTRLHEYDPDTDKWTRKADMPFTGGSLAAGAIDGKLYVISNGNLHEYDPETDEWTRKADVLYADESVPVVVVATVNGKLYAASNYAMVSMGVDRSERTHEMPFRMLREYDPNTKAELNK